MKIFVACESSGIIRDAFRAAGHNAWSCDLLKCEGSQNYHIQGDVRNELQRGWDMMIAHPDCTYLTSAAAWAYADTPMLKGKPRNMKPGTLYGAERRAAQEKALAFVQFLMDADIPRIAIENPPGVIGTRIRPADQWIQPHQYGHDASKTTGLWLKNLPPLQPTEIIQPRWVCCGQVLPEGEGCNECFGKNKPLPRWGNQTDSGQNKLTPSADRWKDRARTYQGWADAMVKFWGHL